MKPISSFFFYAMLFSISLSQLIEAHKTNATNLIEKVCEHSAHKEFCIFSLESDPECEQVTDLNGLASIALKLAHSTAQKTESNMKALLDIEQDEFDGTNSLFKGCGSHWIAASFCIQNSLSALSNQNYDKIYTQVKMAIEQVQHCQELVKEQPRDQITHSYRIFRMLCNNALIITRLLANH